MFDGAASVFSVDGVEYAGNAGTNQPTNLRMFSSGGGLFVTGGVRDGTVYPRALNQGDRQKLAAQLKDKYTSNYQREALTKRWVPFAYPNQWGPGRLPGATHTSHPPRRHPA